LVRRCARSIDSVWLVLHLVAGSVRGSVTGTYLVLGLHTRTVWFAVPPSFTPDTFVYSWFGCATVGCGLQFWLVPLPVLQHHVRACTFSRWLHGLRSVCTHATHIHSYHSSTFKFLRFGSGLPRFYTTRTAARSTSFYGLVCSLVALVIL